MHVVRLWCVIALVVIALASVTGPVSHLASGLASESSAQIDAVEDVLAVVKPATPLRSFLTLVPLGFLAIVALVLGLEGSGPRPSPAGAARTLMGRSRFRRWHARLEGAPPRLATSPV